MKYGLVIYVSLEEWHMLFLGGIKTINLLDYTWIDFDVGWASISEEYAFPICPRRQMGRVLKWLWFVSDASQRLKLHIDTSSMMLWHSHRNCPVFKLHHLQMSKKVDMNPAEMICSPSFRAFILISVQQGFLCERLSCIFDMKKCLHAKPTFSFDLFSSEKKWCCTNRCFPA